MNAARVIYSHARFSNQSIYVYGLVLALRSAVCFFLISIFSVFFISLHFFAVVAAAAVVVISLLLLLFLLCMVIFINTFQLFAFYTFDALKGYALGSERRHFIFAARFNRNTPKIVRNRFREFWEPLESRTKHTRTLRCSAQSQLTWGFSLVHSTSFCFWILVLVIYNLFECNNFQFPFEFAEDFLDFLWWQTPSAAHNFNAILRMKNASLGSLIKLM